MKDLYHVLGVSEDATQAEIKTAYRRRARAVHPDCSDADGQSFRELQAAYDVLGNPARRQAYDRKRRQPQRARRAPAQASTSPFGDREPSTLLAELRRHFGRYSARAGRPSQGSRDVSVRVRITPREVRYGGRLRLRLSVAEVCARCGGAGSAGFYPCAICRGTGIVREEMPVELSFPPGMRDGQRADLSLASLGLDHLKLSLTFTVSEVTQ